MKKVQRLRVAQDDQFVPPGAKSSINNDQSLSVRTTGRIKKPKAVFDPSDNYVPRAQRAATQVIQQSLTPPTKTVTALTSPTSDISAAKRERSLSTGSNGSTASTSISQSDMDMCSVCLKTEPKRGGYYKNRLVSCVECNKKAHRVCMDVDFMDSAPLRQNYKCENCRKCDVCCSNASKMHHELMTCIKCCKFYHPTCHTPNVPKIEQTRRTWRCIECTPKIVKSDSPASNNDSNKIEDIIPVKIIRQIIGDDVSLTNSLRKPPTLSNTANEKLQPQRVNIAEAAAEASAKAAIQRRKRTASMELNNGDYDSESESSEDDNDDDLDYVEKKKRKSGISQINNNSNTVDTSRKSISVASKDAVDDLPKRRDVKTWSVDRVASYISKYFPSESNVFKEQEIDGNALLLLKRSDVVQKLPIKLGPSLRLYNLILKIQTQTANDPTLGWDCSAETLLPSTE